MTILILEITDVDLESGESASTLEATPNLRALFTEGCSEQGGNFSEFDSVNISRRLELNLRY